MPTIQSVDGGMKKPALARGELEGDSGELQGITAATEVEKEEQEKEEEEEDEGCSEFLSSLPPDSIQLNFEITP